MKLNNDSLIFLVDNVENYGDIYEKEMERECRLRGQSISVKLDDGQKTLLNETGYRKLVFSNKSVDNLEDYKVPDKIRIEVLKSLPNRKDLIQISDDFLIKYKKTETYVDVVFFTVDDKREIVNVKYSHFNLLTKETVPKVDEEIQIITGGTVRTDSSVDHLIDMWRKFLVVISYLELTPVTLNIIKGGQKRGDIMKNNIIKNQTKYSVIQVNSNWNTRVIRTDSFTVRSHYRLQGCGVGRQEYKYVLVKSYEKGMVRRLSQKELVQRKVS